jgi:hypothetical protein
MSPTIPTLIVLAALLASPAAEAQIYKCMDPTTKRINFTDRPCAEGEKAEQIEVLPNTVDTSGSREQVLLHEMATLQARLRQAEQAAATPPRSGAELQAERVDSHACAQARRAYELEAGAFKNNPDAIDAKRAAMYGLCGLREPDRVDIRQEVVVPQVLRRPHRLPVVPPVGYSPHDLPREQRLGSPTLYPRALPDKRLNRQSWPAAEMR